MGKKKKKKKPDAVLAWRQDLCGDLAANLRFWCLHLGRHLVGGGGWFSLGMDRTKRAIQILMQQGLQKFYTLTPVGFIQLGLVLRLSAKPSFLQSPSAKLCTKIGVQHIF